MKRSLIALGLIAISVGANAQSFSENFDNIGGATSNGQLGGANLEAAGWFFVNRSSPRGLTDWFQGNTAVFGPQATTGYMAANFNNGAGLATISNWAILPTRTLQNGDVLRFWTRTVNSPAFPDRLQVRMSLNGSSTDVGASATTVGDFTTLLLDINPTYTTTGYPNVWTQFTITLSGIASPTSGRLALRYFVENAGPSGANSDYIGIDTLQYTAIPEPASLFGLGLAALGVLARRRRK